MEVVDRRINESSIVGYSKWKDENQRGLTTSHYSRIQYSCLAKWKGKIKEKWTRDYSYNRGGETSGSMV